MQVYSSKMIAAFTTLFVFGFFRDKLRSCKYCFGVVIFLQTRKEIRSWFRVPKLARMLRCLVERSVKGKEAKRFKSLEDRGFLSGRLFIFRGSGSSHLRWPGRTLLSLMVCLCWGTWECAGGTLVDHLEQGTAGLGPFCSSVDSFFLIGV